MTLAPGAHAAGGEVGVAASPFAAAPLATAPLAAMFQRHGFAVLGPPALEPGELARLRAEAATQRRSASWPLRTGDGRSRVPEDDRRGHLGAAARALLAHPATLALLRATTSRALVPAWSATCYTYYDRPGSFLGMHCDQDEACRVALLVGLESEWPGDQPPPGNQLWVYDAFDHRAPQVKITTRCDRIVILDGARLPHARPPLGPGQRITVLSGCYRQVP